MLVLAIDTSTPVVTAGVVSVLRPHEIVDEAGRVGAARPRPPVSLLAEATRTDAFGHAEYLMPLVREALDRAGATLVDLEAVVVGLGPGPFTGLRVGIATAQALGDALSLPVHGVPSHDGVALAAVGGSPGIGAGESAVPPELPPDVPLVVSVPSDIAAGFLVATDARRREVYLSGYRGGVRRVGPLVAAPTDIAAQLPDDLRPSWVVGAGAELVATVLDLPVRPVAGSVSEGLVRAALRPLITGAVPGPLAPLYLRRPDATVPGAPKPVLPADERAGASR